MREKRIYSFVCDKCGEDFIVPQTTAYRIKRGVRLCQCKDCLHPKWVKVKCNRCGRERMVEPSKAKRYKGTSCPLCKKPPSKKSSGVSIEDKARAIKAQEAALQRIDVNASFLQSKVHQTDWEKDKEMIDYWLSNNEPTIKKQFKSEEPYQSGQIIHIDR